MDDQLKLLGKILAEVRLLQRWGGGDAVDRGRIFGLLHGFETALRQELEGEGISEDLQDRAEKVFEKIDEATVAPSSMIIKQWLREAGVPEHIAAKAMHNCVLDGRFVDTADKLHRPMHSRDGAVETQALTANLYIELVDASGGGKPRAAFCAAVPRIGELIRPEAGSPMRVIDVEYHARQDNDSLGVPRTVLVPNVLLAPHDEVEDLDE